MLPDSSLLGWMSNMGSSHWIVAQDLPPSARAAAGPWEAGDNPVNNPVLVAVPRQPLVLFDSEKETWFHCSKLPWSRGGAEGVSKSVPPCAMGMTGLCSCKVFIRCPGTDALCPQVPAHPQEAASTPVRSTSTPQLTLTPPKVSLAPQRGVQGSFPVLSWLG